MGETEQELPPEQRPFPWRPMKAGQREVDGTTIGAQDGISAGDLENNERALFATLFNREYFVALCDERMPNTWPERTHLLAVPHFNNRLHEGQGREGLRQLFSGRVSHRAKRPNEVELDTAQGRLLRLWRSHDEEDCDFVLFYRGLRVFASSPERLTLDRQGMDSENLHRVLALFLLLFGYDLCREDNGRLWVSYLYRHGNLDVSSHLNGWIAVCPLRDGLVLDYHGTAIERQRAAREQQQRALVGLFTPLAYDDEGMPLCPLCETPALFSGTVGVCGECGTPLSATSAQRLLAGAR